MIMHSFYDGLTLSKCLLHLMMISSSLLDNGTPLIHRII